MVGVPLTFHGFGPQFLIGDSEHSCNQGTLYLPPRGRARLGLSPRFLQLIQHKYKFLVDTGLTHVLPVTLFLPTKLTLPSVKVTNAIRVIELDIHELDTHALTPASLC